MDKQASREQVKAACYLLGLPNTPLSDSDVESLWPHLHNFIVGLNRIQTAKRDKQAAEAEGGK